MKWRKDTTGATIVTVNTSNIIAVKYSNQCTRTKQLDQKSQNFRKKSIPNGYIDQNVKIGIPPPSPVSFPSSEELENCTIELPLVPLRKHLMDLLVLTMWVTTATCISTKLLKFSKPLLNQILLENDCWQNFQQNVIQGFYFAIEFDTMWWGLRSLYHVSCICFHETLSPWKPRQKKRQ